MYTNLTKGQAFPLAVRVCSRPRCFKSFHTSKPQSLQIGSHPKPPLNLSWVRFTKPTCGSDHKTYGMSHLVHFPTDSCYKIVERGINAKPRSVTSGFRLRSRGFSNWSTQKVNGGSGVARAGKRLPWLPAAKAKEAKGLEKATATKISLSSWEESAKMLEKVSDNASWGESAKSFDGDSSKSSWDKSAKRSGEENKSKTGRSSWEVSAETFVGKSGSREQGRKESRTRIVSMVKDRQSDYSERNARLEEADTEGDEEKEEEMEVVDDPRWDKIKYRFRGMEDEKFGSRRPENQRWNRQENWGRKTWKEATESSVPRMVGQGVYGVGPVLAALSARRREFYALYIQEGLDFSNNNKKKKDKKSFERVLRMADKLGLSIKDVSKHDLNMVVDNRPHQGLVLDASALEMVKIKELDPVSVEEDKGSLWVALDEVTDPQNLGAIIRSAYFFGASGVVLCAKNSAPLSGVVSKASAGSLEFMELRYCKNMMQFLTTSAENGWRVLGGSVSTKAIPLNEVVPSVPTILVLGSEGTGLRPLVERSCTDLIRIPGNIPLDVTASGVDDSETVDMNHGCSAQEFRSFLAVESLNVSVAAGVLLHHLTGNNYKKDVNVVDGQIDGLD